MHTELLTLATDVARESAAIIRRFYGTAHVTEKQDSSPVTEADIAAHEHIAKRLGETGIPILSEEDAELRALPYPEQMWIVDPLDGTKGFIKGTDDFSVMIALIEHGRPVLSVVYLPIGDVVYSAIRGSGSWVHHNGEQETLRVSNRTQPHLRGMLSVNHLAPYMLTLNERLSVAETVSVGSIGIKAGYIAHDKADFYVNQGKLGEWDVCAPELILTEAGGMVTDTHGEPLFYGTEDHRIMNGVVFSNGTAHDLILDAIEEAT
jgi:3'(2'), 5'-bisphosphate nucleotidase